MKYPSVQLANQITVEVVAYSTNERRTAKVVTFAF